MKFDIKFTMEVEGLNCDYSDLMAFCERTANFCENEDLYLSIKVAEQADDDC